MRKQFRLVIYRLRVDPDGLYAIETAWSPRKNFTSRAAAERHAQRFGPEPWKAFGLGPDDHWCEGGAAMREDCGKEWSGDQFDPPYLCATPKRTCREAFSNSSVGQLLRVEVQERTVSPWATVGTIHDAARAAEPKEGA